MILTLIQIITFILYVTFILIKFGVLPSISESWYRLEEEKLGFLFTFFCWIIGFCMLFQTNGSTGLFFLSGTGLCFVGAATAFKMKGAYTNIVHFIGALSCVIGGFLGLGIEYSLWIPGIIFLVSLSILNLVVSKNRMFWSELLSFVLLGVGLLLK